ncbi:hypothetical protein BGZ75_001787, partial [Mortierella antarctica]
MTTQLRSLLYGSDWLRDQSGGGLIASLKAMPKFKNRSPKGQICEHDKPITPTQAGRPEGVPYLKELPEASVIRRA